VGETYLKVRGRWAYLYGTIDRDGRLVDTMLSVRRDVAAAPAFLRSAKATIGVIPDRVTTDAHGSYPRAVCTTLDRRVAHRASAFKSNRLEQDHRGISSAGQSRPKAARPLCGAASRDAAMERRVMRSAILDPRRRLRVRGRRP
jgi:transposase-like protein